MADLIGQQFGNYQLIRLLGRGGFGVVYLGQHLRINMQAAIKVQHLQLADEEIEAFHHEAETIASLVHPHIVRVLDFDVKDGVPFLIMDYAPNGSLRQRHPKGIQLPLLTILSYVKHVGDALQYAHDQKLIHRDVKPDNMLLGRYNEVLLSDFGITTIAHSTSSQSTQVMAGTIPYMAPEQVQGKPRPASDQYALGIVVYEWLSGSRPFNGTATEIAMQHIHAPIPSLREKEPTILPEVEHVVMTALAKEPKQRFASIQAFAKALEQASRISSHTILSSNEAKQPADTHPVLSQLTISTELVTPPDQPPAQPPLLPVISPEPTRPPMASNPITLADPPSLPTKRVASPDQSSFLTEVVTPFSVSTGSPSSVRAVEPSHEPQPSQRRISRRAVIGLATLAVAGSGITWLAISHGQQGSSASLSPTAIPSPTATPSPTPIPLGTTLVTYKGHSNRVWSVAWSPDNTRIASAGLDHTVQVWNPITGKQVVIFRGHSDAVPSVAWSPDSKRIASASYDKSIQVWDPITGNQVFSYPDHSVIEASVSWSSDGTRIASGDYASRVQVWNASTGNLISTYNGFLGFVLFAVAWSPDGKRIASAGGEPTTVSSDNTARVSDAASGNELSVYRGHSKNVSAVAWSPDGKRVASASADTTVQVWNAVDGGHVLTYSGHSNGVGAVAWSPDGKHIASASETVQIWDAATGNQIFTYRNHSDWVSSVTWSPDGKHIASGSYDTTVQVWQAV